MRMTQLNNCTVLRGASGKWSGQLPQFLPPASRAVDQLRCAVADSSTPPHLLVDDVVIRFDIQLDSFRVSTSSAIAIRMLPVFRFWYPSSTFAHHWLQNCASSVKHSSLPSAPLRSISLQSTSHHSFQICMIAQLPMRLLISATHSQIHSPRFQTHRDSVSFGYLTFRPDPLTSGFQRSPAQSTRLVLNQFCCCCNC